ncbi:uncharacterized protein LOC107366599 [Tetranychus urticae]|uniref:uncharacterized protein LOC107366599 n=1 Tax=Tetranychus urticae TaxID=32264 RepID=UPI00077C00CE|nr:uncharacterized protein LOC107366599 [Tetranychus urticae]
MIKQVIEWFFPLFTSTRNIDNFFGHRNFYIKSSFPEQEINVGPKVWIYSILQMFHAFVLLIRCLIYFFAPETNKLIYGDTLSIYGHEGDRFAILLIIFSIAAGLSQLSFHTNVNRRHYPFWTRVFKFEKLGHNSRSQCSLHLNWVDRLRFLTFRSYYMRFIRLFEFLLLLPIIGISIPVLFHDGPLLIWSLWFCHNVRNSFTIMFIGFTLPSCLAVVHVYINLRLSTVIIQLDSIKKQTAHIIRSHFRAKYKSPSDSSFSSRASTSFRSPVSKSSKQSFTIPNEVARRLVNLIQEHGELCWEIRKFNVFWKRNQLYTFFAGFSSICLLGFLTTATDIHLPLKLAYAFIMVTAFVYCVAGPFLAGALMFHQTQRINKKFIILLRYMNDFQSRSKILVSLEQLTIFKGFTLFDIFNFTNNGFAWMLLRLIRYLLLAFKRLRH